MLDVVLAGHNTYIAGAAGSGKSFLIQEICERTTKGVFVTSTTGRAAKVLKDKTKTIHSFAGIGDCHEPKEVCFVWLIFFFFVSEKYILKYIGAHYWCTRT